MSRHWKRWRLWEEAEFSSNERSVDAKDTGERYLEHLVGEGVFNVVPLYSI
jgi:hypothetical protein